MPTRLLRHPLTRLLLTVLVTGLLAALLALATEWRTYLHRSDVAQMLYGPALMALSTFAALLLVARFVERRAPGEVGLGLRGAGREAALGLLVGAGLMVAVVGVMAALGWYRLVDGPPETAAGEARDALTWAAIFTCVALWEEAMFRGVLFRLVEEWLGSGAALLASSAFFGLGHATNPHATHLASLAIALEAGLLLGACYMLTRRLWFVTGVHLAWNWTQGALLGVAVSGATVPGVLESELVGPVLWTGGPFGAEAGLVAILVCTTAGAGVLWLAVRRGHWRPLLARRREVQAARAAAAPGAP